MSWSCCSGSNASKAASTAAASPWRRKIASIKVSDNELILRILALFVLSYTAPVSHRSQSDPDVVYSKADAPWVILTAGRDCATSEKFPLVSADDGNQNDCPACADSRQ